jgi:hypothetical protein
MSSRYIEIVMYLRESKQIYTLSFLNFRLFYLFRFINIIMHADIAYV